MTNHPYLYGITSDADERRRLWGILQAPRGSESVTFEIRQGLRRGTPRDGSAARFDDVDLLLFHTRAEAEAFVDEQGALADLTVARLFWPRLQSSMTTPIMLTVPPRRLAKK